MQDQLVPILQKCLNLRYLALGGAQKSSFERLPSSRGAYIDPRLIFSLCPHLIYFEAYNFRYSEYRKMAIDRLQQNHQLQYKNSKLATVIRATISSSASNSNNSNGLPSLIVFMRVIYIIYLIQPTILVFLKIPIHWNSLY